MNPLDPVTANLQRRARQAAVKIFGSEETLDEMTGAESARRAGHTGTFEHYYAGPQLGSLLCVKREHVGSYTSEGLISVIGPAWRESRLTSLLYVIAAHAGKRDRIVCSFENGTFLDAEATVQKMTPQSGA